MALFGNTFISAHVDELYEAPISVMEAYTIINEFGAPKLLQDEKIDAPDLCKGGSHLVSKLNNIIKKYEDSGKEKKLHKIVYGVYYAVVGNSFYEEVPKIKKGENIKYQPKYGELKKVFEKYCTEKELNIIKKDAKGTVEACEKMINEGKLGDNKVLIAYYKAYAADVKKLV